MNIPKTHLPRILVIGSGFAGLKFLKAIDGRLYQVVVLDKNNFHTFQPLLYQVATSGLEPDSVVYPVRKILQGRKNFHFRLAEVLNINTVTRSVSTSIGKVEYDMLVIATGGVSNYFGLANVKRYSVPMKSLNEALNLRSIIIQNFESALGETDNDMRERFLNFAIVGGGPTGIELAGALAELKNHILPRDYPELDISRMQIHVIEALDRLLPTMSETASQKSARYLKELGVTIWLNTHVLDYDGDTVFTDNGQLSSKTLIWAAGVKGNVPDGVEEVSKKGNRIIVDEFNAVKGLTEVYAIGDVALIESAKYPKGNPMLGSVAEQQGYQLARNLNRKARSQPMRPFHYFDKGTMATIGRNRAVVDFPFMKLGGLLGWLIWIFVHLMLLVEFRNRLVVFVNWCWSYFSYDKAIRLITRDVGMLRKSPRSTNITNGKINGVPPKAESTNVI